MKSGRTLVQLAEEIQRRAGAKHDYVAKAEAITMEAIGESKEIELALGGERFSVNEITHDQIGQYVQIPAAYYDRMRHEAPELLATNVNRWMSQSNGKRMVRTLDGKARAFLSDKFRPIENEDLAETVLPLLLDGGRFDIMSCEVTERKLYIKVVDKSVSRKLAETGNFMGDGKHRIVRIAAPAITISNSEVGMGALSIQAGIYDSFCSNLATFAARSMKKYHVGARHDLLGEDVVALLSAQTQNLTNAALMSQVRDVVTNAFDPARFNELVDTVEGTAQEKISDVDVVKLVNLTGKQIGLTEGENKGVLSALIEGGDLTRFGLYNAVTAFSQKVESYDRATELERAGAAVVELAQPEWQRLLALAA
jgi:hypothetical protein